MDRLRVGCVTYLHSYTLVACMFSPTSYVGGEDPLTMQGFHIPYIYSWISSNVASFSNMAGILIQITSVFALKAWNFYQGGDFNVKLLKPRR